MNIKRFFIIVIVVAGISWIIGRNFFGKTRPTFKLEKIIPQEYLQKKTNEVFYNLDRLLEKKTNEIIELIF